MKQLLQLAANDVSCRCTSMSARGCRGSPGDTSLELDRLLMLTMRLDNTVFKCI